MDATSYPTGRVVKLSARNPADFGEEEVVLAGKVFVNEGRIEGFTQKFFGGTVVGRGIEGADAEGQGAVDNACGWQCVRIWIILIVECRCSADEWR